MMEHVLRMALEAREREKRVVAFRHRLEGVFRAVARRAQHVDAPHEARARADEHGEILLGAAVVDRHEREPRGRVRGRGDREAAPAERRRDVRRRAHRRGRRGALHVKDERSARGVEDDELALESRNRARVRAARDLDRVRVRPPLHRHVGRAARHRAQGERVVARAEAPREHTAVQHHLRLGAERRHLRDRRLHADPVRLARAHGVVEAHRAVKAGGGERTERAEVRGNLERRNRAVPQPRGVHGAHDRIAAPHVIAEGVRRHVRERGVRRRRLAVEHEEPVRIVGEEAVDPPHAERRVRGTPPLRVVHAPGLRGVVLLVGRERTVQVVLVAAEAGTELEIVHRAVVREPHAEALAGVEHHAHLLLVGRILRPVAARAQAHEVVGAPRQAVLDARLHVHLGEAGGRLVVEGREETLRREGVDVVLAVEEHLLEAVSVAAGLRGGQSARRREQVGGEAVERTAFEAAVAVEHLERLVFDALRQVAARPEDHLVVHEVVACAQHEVEDPVRLFGVGGGGERERVGDVAEAARVEFARVDEDRVAERSLPVVRDFHEVHVGRALHAETVRGAGREAETRSMRAACGEEVPRVGHLRIVEPV